MRILASAKTVLEEMTGKKLPRDHVKRRLDDWMLRIVSLYRIVGDALPAGWSVDRSQKGTTAFHSNVLVQAGLEPPDLPVLELTGPEGLKARVEPRSLWIVGANGRVDLVGPGGHFVIVDRSELFSESRWEIAPLADRSRGRPLSAEAIRAALTG